MSIPVKTTRLGPNEYTNVRRTPVLPTGTGRRCRRKGDSPIKFERTYQRFVVKTWGYTCTKFTEKRSVNDYRVTVYVQCPGLPLPSFKFL